jgi:hypothetical protein
MRDAILLIALAGCGSRGSVTDGVTHTHVDPTPTTDTGAPPTDEPSFTGFRILPHPDVGTLLLVEWSQAQDADETWLTWSFEGVDHTSPHVARPAGQQHEVVLGLPAEVTVDVAVHALVGGADTIVASGPGTTDPLPDGLPAPRLTTADLGAMRPEEWLLTSVNSGPDNFFGPCFTVILDRQGRIVWYRLTSDHRLTLLPRVGRDGGSLAIEETTVYVQGTPSITRTTLDLEQVQTTPVPDMFMVYAEMADGSFLFDESVSAYEFYLSRQYPDGTRERIWWCNPWMNAYSSEYWACATNTLNYDPVRNTVLWSMFQTSTVAEVDLATGAPIREYGQFPGGFVFDPPTAQFDLQHNVNWSADGTLMVSTHVPSQPGAQRARELEVDEVTGTLHELWSAEADSYAEYEGGVWKLANGNYLWELGTAGEIVELTPTGDTAWRIDWNGHLTGALTVVPDLYALNAGF